MNRDEKAAVVEEVAAQISASEAVFAVDYRGLTVPQAAELRTKLRDADATFRIVKNSLGERAADRAGAEALKAFLVGPTALTIVNGDAALAAKTLNDTARVLRGLLEFKGGLMNGSALSAQDVTTIARLPSRDVLTGQLVGMVAAPLVGLVRGLNGLLAGVAIQLAQVLEQRGGAPAVAEPEPEAAEPEAAAPEPEPEAAAPEAAAPEPEPEAAAPEPEPEAAAPEPEPEAAAPEPEPEPEAAAPEPEPEAAAPEPEPEAAAPEPEPEAAGPEPEPEAAAPEPEAAAPEPEPEAAAPEPEPEAAAPEPEAAAPELEPEAAAPEPEPEAAAPAPAPEPEAAPADPAPAATTTSEPDQDAASEDASDA
ncbi:MAG TPA: 50S ribosomal protein L10 [Solirubrobacteraceae bacterium]|jgi:large subunit ribosomal protein L10|nr:50S ribosomal protein L10 [Solirubrobacteraceae bacterium]